MSDIILMMQFFVMCVTAIFTIMDNTILSGYSILDWFCAMAYITITFWGVFELLGYKSTAGGTE